MENEFWHQRWREGRIGFHQPTPNAQLLTHWQSLGLARGSTIFVPLAGKSTDMTWLLAEGYKVLGIELSRVAVEAFFAENNLEAAEEHLPDFDVFRAQNIEFRCGDFFALTAEDLASVDAVYDRAALIALPPEMRAAYAAHMTRCLPPGAEMLLVTLEYPQAEMAGPPFSVSEEEVSELYGADFNIERVGSVSVGAEGRPPAGKDLSEMLEKTYHLTRKKAV
ncbi:MAG: thiopurine S-methyltransferase [Proteobacteria bacterium]|nr:thiopurine S-methyltransferase [Pseudomonadota bacterium]